MTSAELAQRAEEALVLAVKLSAPTLAAVGVTGALTSWLAGSVRANDPAVGTLPKLAVAALTLVATFRWMSDELVAFVGRTLG